MIAWLLHHWIPLAGVGVLLLAVVFPAISAPLLRFLIGTERGRYLLAVLLAVGVFLWYRDHRWNVGYSAAVAEQARAADRQTQAARLKEQANADRLAAIAEHYEKEKRDGAQAAYDRALDDVRAGRVRLRGPWACPLSGTAAAPGERDAAADDRAEAAARIVRIGAEADAQLRACQAIVEADRQ